MTTQNRQKSNTKKIKKRLIQTVENQRQLIIIDPYYRLSRIGPLD